MGKQAKLGPSRKDKFYKKAKEAGYRARSAFKLIQLNKKYEFLERSRVCIDLCAAPGSWMQVASKYMPASSVIIGVDLYPIMHIPNTIGIVGDIFAEKTKQQIQTTLKNYKADLVLHDGAPDLGTNWLLDAYQQNLLVLRAFKMACEFLRKGGIFVSKVFRSQDHTSLQFVFRKLFQKVEATKPIASRFESAEMFVICSGFLAPEKVDQEFFDPKSVFQHIETDPRKKVNLLKNKSKPKALGYEDGATMLFKRCKISSFLQAEEPLLVLAEANEFEWDDEIALKSRHTTHEVLEACKDIKVLGKFALKALLKWRDKVKADMTEPDSETPADPEDILKSHQAEEEEVDVDEEMKEYELAQQQVLELKSLQSKEERRVAKMKERKLRKLKEKQKLQLTVHGDTGPRETKDTDLFDANRLNLVDSLDFVHAVNAKMSTTEEEDMEPIHSRSKSYSLVKRDESALEEDGLTFKHVERSDSESSDDSDSDTEFDKGLNLEKKKKKVSFAIDETKPQLSDEAVHKHDRANPLITDLQGDDIKDLRDKQAEKWFSEIGEDFEGENDALADIEMDAAINSHVDKGGTFFKKEEIKVEDDDDTTTAPEEHESVDDIKEPIWNGVCDAPIDDGTQSDSDSESDSESEKPLKKGKKREKLTAQQLAFATKMVHSQKAKNDIYDKSWNRYMRGDEDDLPKWFVEEENKYYRPLIDLEHEDLVMYRQRDKGVDARNIKKVVESRSRKRQRALRLMTKLRKKADVVLTDADMSQREKMAEVQKIYKGVAAPKSKEKKYIVMRKFRQGKKPRTKGGPSIMVDSRQKKDKRKTMAKDKKKGKWGKNRGNKKRNVNKGGGKKKKSFGRGVHTR